MVENETNPVFENNSARVYETRYRPIEGIVKPPSQKESGKTMAVFEIRRGLRGTWPKVPLILAGFIVFGALLSLDQFLGNDATEFWLGGEPEVVEGEEVGTPPSVRSSIFSMLVPMDGPGGIILIHIAVISAGLISGDLRDRAIDLYYSKISVRSYFVSKVIASMVLTFIGMPLFTFIFFIIAFYKRFGIIENYQEEFLSMGEVLLRMSLSILVIVFLLSVIVLVFSAYTSNPVNAGVGFIVFAFISRVFFESILYSATNIDMFYALSPISALDTIHRRILSPDEISDQFFELSVISYLIYMGISLAMIWFKLMRERNK